MIYPRSCNFLLKLHSVRNKRPLGILSAADGRAVVRAHRSRCVYPVSRQVAREGHEILDEVAREDQSDTSNGTIRPGTVRSPRHAPRYNSSCGSKIVTGFLLRRLNCTGDTSDTRDAVDCRRYTRLSAVESKDAHVNRYTHIFVAAPFPGATETPTLSTFDTDCEKRPLVLICGTEMSYSGRIEI